MLLEFTVENYRSIKEPVTLSAVAQKSRKKANGKKRDRFKSDEEICPGFPVEGWDIELLPVMAIFGANASGKSNVIQALDYLLLKLTGQYFKSANHFFPRTHQPFNLNTHTQNQPTKFDLHLALDSNIYQYYLELHGQKVLQEALHYLPVQTKRSRLLFERSWNNLNQQYEWKNGEMFAGSHVQLEKLIGQEELFITLMSRLTVPIITPLIEFLSICVGGSILASIDVDNQVGADLIRDLAAESPNFKDGIVQILRKFDVGIIDLELKEPRHNGESGIYAVHHNAQGENIVWRFEEESLGTQRLFSFAYSVIIVLEDGGLVLIDELGTNLHPKITSYIIQLFQNPKTNPKGAQLIFTSHDNTLQRNQLLRRDQIWFTEKKTDQSTDLYSLADFKVRNDLAIDKAYLDGRFGAIPFLPETVEELMGVE